MREYNFAFGKIKKELDEQVTGITKCYILLKYAYNSKEDEIKYKEEFKNRYISFSKNINETAEYIDEKCLNSDEIKDLLALGFYQSSMSFLDEKDIEIKAFNSEIEEDYNKKTTADTVKRNFYHNNNCEFGSKTREHVNLTQYGIIDPEAKNDTEDAFIFSALTTYFRNTFSKEFIKDKKSLILQNK